MNEDDLEESLRELYEQAPCGYIFTLPDGMITRVNATFLRWTGYTRDDLVAKRRFQDLLTVPGKIFYENQYAPLLRMQGAVNEIALDLVREGREPLPVLVNSVQKTDAHGRPLLIASTIFDATDRRAYERELLLARREAEQLAAVVRASSDAILIGSQDGVIATCNAAAERLFGYPAGALIGRELRDVLLPSGGEVDWQRISAELQAGRAVHLETVGRHADGRQIDMSIGLTPQPGPLGDLVAISAIIRDIGERRALERLQQEFLAMASHELRDPVAAIKIYAQLMQHRGSYSERAVDAIVSQADQLWRLVDDLLMASQIQTDRLDLRLEEINLIAEARDAAEHLNAAGHSVRVESPPGPLMVAADRHRLGQVLANLLTNAVKYSPEGSEIVARLTVVADKALVAIIDQGAGIPPEALPHLFDRFYRVAGAAERAAGLGLGLYITRWIVEAHGGRIEVESELGHGSTFTIVLPLHGSPDDQPRDDKESHRPVR